jgi:hypothetical protein
MKPKLLCDVLRQDSPRKFYGNPNRYTILRDASPADSIRSNLSTRSVAVKRKGTQDEISGSQISYASIASGPVPTDPAPAPETQEALTEKIVKVRSICDKVTTDLSNENLDPQVVLILANLNQAIMGVCDVQQKIVESKNTAPDPCITIGSQSSGNYSTVNQAKRARKNSSEPEMVDLSVFKRGRDPIRGTQSSQGSNTREGNNPDTDQDPRLKKFKDTVREAEKSTLVLNLNLGKVPTINQDTISKKVTIALTEMAAKTENAKGKIPSDETAASLDDVLSVVKGMKFYGKSTKSFRSKTNPDSGSYCTVPVRYDFHDMDARIYAETFLRDKCKVQCCTPYPTILRECIRQIIDQVKKDFPNFFVRVTVDTNNMCFRILRRPLVDKNYKGKKEWFRCDDTIPIPDEALDIYARFVPDNFKLKGIPVKNRKSSNNSSSHMEDISGSQLGTEPESQSRE